MPYDNRPIRSIQSLKNKVIQRRTSGQVKKANVLCKAISAYERSSITIDYLWDIFRQLQN